MKKPVVLIIRDGWGISPVGTSAAQKEGNAPLLAKTPFHDHLYATYPRATLRCSGEDVGLPDGQMGNSEVGHLNLGAGRIVYQDLTRINKAIANGELDSNPALVALCEAAKKSGGVLHLIGLLSDGGVHSHQEHLYALVAAAKKAGVGEILIHALMDGRDTSPTGGREYLVLLEQKLKEIGAGRIATVIGRYFAMDRDNRWERVQQAYDLIVSGKGTAYASASDAIEAAYAANKTDEFVPASVIDAGRRPLMRDGDAVLFFNFRSDRAREISQPLILEKFDQFTRSDWPRITYASMTTYDKTFNKPVLFAPQSMQNIFGEVVSNAGRTQLRIAETEKYPHVTYFFNGGIEVPYLGETRKMIASPKVATYDLQPEMSEPEVTRTLLAELDSGAHDAVILNYANPDMVGHTGSLEATILAVEAVDRGVEQVVKKVLELGGQLLITADHGNCEKMFAEEGGPHTAHTTNLVHLIYVSERTEGVKVKDGILADVAPTLLDMLGIPKPSEMTGSSLLQRA
jgi:2,3-bisphosphoglycerate-independent phosphoglycerate mutase